MCVCMCVCVQDVNDNVPEFTQTTYSTSVREDVSSGVEVIRVMANDRDSGLLGRLVYSIGSVEGPASFDTVSGSFVLQDNTEGVIYTSGSFDRESFEGPYTINVNITFISVCH